MRHFLCLLLVLSSFSSAALTTIDDVRADVRDLEGFVAKEEEKNPLLTEEVMSATSISALDGVAFNFGLLYPDAYNTLLLESITRYVKEPKSRPFLFQLWKRVAKLLAPVYAAQGFDFWNSSVRGIIFYGNLAALVGSPIRGLLLRGKPGALLNELNFRKSLWKVPIFKGLGMTNEAKNVLALYGAGVAASYVQEWRDANQSQKLDPRPAFLFENALLGCEIQTAATAKDLTTNLDQLTDMVTQALLIEQQTPELADIEINGERMQDAIARLRRENQWQNSLPMGIKCDAVKLDAVIPILVSKGAKIKSEAAPELKPPPPPQPGAAEKSLAPKEAKPK